MMQQQTNNTNSLTTCDSTQLVKELFERLDALDRDANQLGFDIQALPDDKPQSSPQQLYYGSDALAFGCFSIAEPLTEAQRANLGGMDNQPWICQQTTRMKGKTKGKRDEYIRLPVAVFVREGNNVKRTRTIRSNDSLCTLLQMAKSKDMTVCKSVKKMVAVKSESDPKQVYKLGFDLATGSWQCNCLGYHYRSACKHVNAMNP